MSSVRQTSDFFSHQDQARKKGFIYLLLFGLIVLITVLIIYLLGAKLMIVSARKAPGPYSIFGNPPTVWRLGTALSVTTILASAIFAVSWVKTAALKNEAGVYELARLLDGRIPDDGEIAPDERRAINIVEEMAVAAGLPCPEVLILTRQPGINAFAAGFSPQQSVIGLTQGALDRLDRDELQAVVAHEFGHILSGDTRLNMKLAGWLYGLLAVSISGKFLLRSRRVELLILGFMAWGVGQIGYLGAQIMQAAISRQREYLADSRGAQFTRNPEALARALRKIGGLAGGGNIKAPAAMMFKHMFIASPMKSLFQSHPSLEGRVRRLSPSWDGTYLDAPLKPEAQKREDDLRIQRKETLEAKRAAKASEQLQQNNLKRKKEILLDRVAIPITAMVGAVMPENLAAATALLSSWPESLRRAAEAPLKSTAVVAVTLLSSQHLDRQLPVVRKFFGETWARQILAWHQELEQSGPSSRLPLLDLAVPALKRLEGESKKKLRGLAQELVWADGGLNLFEFAALEILKNVLDGPAPMANPVTRFSEVRQECEALLNYLAWQGHPGDRAAAAASFLAGAGAFKSSIGAGGLGEESDCQLEILAGVLAVLAQTTPEMKRIILSAALLCLSNDSVITLAEYETLRALGAALDCPLPLLAPTALNGRNCFRAS